MNKSLKKLFLFVGLIPVAGLRISAAIGAPPPTPYIVHKIPADIANMQMFGCPGATKIFFSGYAKERCFQLVMHSKANLNQIAAFYEGQLLPADSMQAMLKTHPKMCYYNAGEYHFSYFRDIESGILEYDYVYQGDSFAVSVHKCSDFAIINVFVKWAQVGSNKSAAPF